MDKEIIDVNRYIDLMPDLKEKGSDKWGKDFLKYVADILRQEYGLKDVILQETPEGYKLLVQRQRQAETQEQEKKYKFTEAQAQPPYPQPDPDDPTTPQEGGDLGTGHRSVSKRMSTR